MNEAIIAVDVGSSGCRAVLFDFHRRALVRASHGYSIDEPRPGWMEQDPRVILRSMGKSIRGVTRDSRARGHEIQCLCFSAFLHSLLNVDRRGRPLAPLQTWGDSRSEVPGSEEKIAFESLYRRTGCIPHPSYPLWKIRWQRRHRKEIFRSTDKFISVKSYLLWKLCRRFVEDISVASATGLLNLRSLRWDAEALALCGVKEPKLPDLVSPYEVVGVIRPGEARSLGLPAGIPVIAGAGDGPLANVGGGAFGRGETNITVGSSAAVRVLTNQPVLDSKRRLWCYRLDEEYYVFGGSSNNGGFLIDWALEQFGLQEARSTRRRRVDVEREVLRRLEKPTGLVFYPFLRGERSPYWDPRLRAGVLGIQAGDDRYDLMAAVFAGLAFNLRTILAVLSECHRTEREIVCGGGTFRSNAFARVLADVLNRKIRIPRELEVSARGACAIGLKAVKGIESLRAAQDPRGFYREIAPEPRRARAYEKRFGIYEALLPALRSLGKGPDGSFSSNRD